MKKTRRWQTDETAPDRGKYVSLFQRAAKDNNRNGASASARVRRLLDSDTEEQLEETRNDYSPTLVPVLTSVPTFNPSLSRAPSFAPLLVAGRPICSTIKPNERRAD